MKDEGLKSFQNIKPDDPEFPSEYDQFYKIKSPLSVLWYNLRTEFVDSYPAKMHPDFARDMITWYSKPGDVVWDGCCGSGTIPIIACKLGRTGWGTDVNPKAIELTKKHCIENRIYDNTIIDGMIWTADCRTIELPQAPDLIFSSLPFGLNIIGDKNHYSEEPNDISNCKTYDKFFDGSKEIIESYYRNLKPGGLMILDARDRTKEGKLYDVINHFRNQALEAGFQLVARYMYFQMPYRTMTYIHKETDSVMPMVAAFDAMVFFKPIQEKLVFE